MRIGPLVVRIDSQLTMADHIAALSRSCFFQLRQLRSIKQSLTFEATKTLVHSFVASRLDYCNSVFAGVSGQLLHKLQMIQNGAARLITGTKKFEHIKPVVGDLHWLPVRLRIDFKTALLVFKCTRDLAIPYLVALCHATSECPGRVAFDPPTCTRCMFRGQGHIMEIVVSLSTVQLCGTVCQLVDLRAPDISIDIFKNQLKAFLFTAVC